ncbi:hypothetical protein BU26DRAFT_566730 [Trematosphaeria pertusa]|uniref:Uncharacterized protein n=1 Tax=Trematosphaeria pertusa TaxID=390896 RepID=A0A6A6IE55_9PLEO|nr:uncharacterized protein BU26DRAFT_566730 [Trematosphaeria pertusa]KAF2247783.1 hypothetical protein BU26DRAFT_566730 [Trematosphaeria pertusa]
MSTPLLRRDWFNPALNSSHNAAFRNTPGSLSVNNVPSTSSSRNAHGKAISPKNRSGNAVNVYANLPPRNSNNNVPTTPSPQPPTPPLAKASAALTPLIPTNARLDLHLRP